MILIKDKILKDKCEKKVIKDYFNTDDDWENDKIVMDDGEDIFSQVGNKKNKHKKKLTEICDHQNKENQNNKNKPVKNKDNWVNVNVDDLVEQFKKTEEDFNKSKIKEEKEEKEEKDEKEKDDEEEKEISENEKNNIDDKIINIKEKEKEEDEKYEKNNKKENEEEEEKEEEEKLQEK